MHKVLVPIGHRCFPLPPMRQYLHSNVARHKQSNRFTARVVPNSSETIQVCTTVLVPIGDRGFVSALMHPYLHTNAIRHKHFKTHHIGGMMSWSAALINIEITQGRKVPYSVKEQGAFLQLCFVCTSTVMQPATQTINWRAHTLAHCEQQP